MKTPAPPRAVRVLIALLLGLLVALPPMPVAHAEGDHDPNKIRGLSIAAVGPDGKTDKRTRYNYKVDPGQTVTDKVSVMNISRDPLHVAVFATDALNDEAGNYTLLPTQQEPKGVGSWVTFDGGKRAVEMDLPAGDEQIVGFTVTVPKNATPGDHPGGVALAAIMQEDNVKVERRVAERMYVRVNGDLNPTLTISSYETSYVPSWNPLDGKIKTKATLTNNGNVGLAGRIALTASTWGGANIGTPQYLNVDEILPGNTRTLEFEIPKVPGTIYANTDWTLASSIEGDAIVPHKPLPVVKRDAFVWTPPWMLIAVLALVIATVLTLRWRRKKRAAEAAAWQAELDRQAAEKAETEAKLERLEKAAQARAGKKSEFAQMAAAAVGAGGARRAAPDVDDHGGAETATTESAASDHDQSDPVHTDNDEGSR